MYAIVYLLKKNNHFEMSQYQRNFKKLKDVLDLAKKFNDTVINEFDINITNSPKRPEFLLRTPEREHIGVFKI